MTDLTGKYFKAYDSDKTPLWVIFIEHTCHVSPDSLINTIIDRRQFVQEITKEEYDKFEFKITMSGEKFTFHTPNSNERIF